MFYEYSKAAFFGSQIDYSASLLRHAMILFPDEWKLALELVNQLIYQDRRIEALALCKKTLLMHLSAGRLWALYIHLIHEYENRGYF